MQQVQIPGPDRFRERKIRLRQAVREMDFLAHCKHSPARGDHRERVSVEEISALHHPPQETTIVFPTGIRPAASAVTGNLILPLHVGGIRERDRRTDAANPDIAERDLAAPLLQTGLNPQIDRIVRNRSYEAEGGPVAIALRQRMRSIMPFSIWSAPLQVDFSAVRMPSRLAEPIGPVLAA